MAAERILFVTRGTDEDVCAICLGGVRRRVFRTPCGHHYHCQCLRRHMERSSRCPMCRAHMPALPSPRGSDEARLDDELREAIRLVESLMAHWQGD